jgi:hypothetical protein
MPHIKLRLPPARTTAAPPQPNQRAGAVRSGAGTNMASSPRKFAGALCWARARLDCSLALLRAVASHAICRRVIQFPKQPLASR